MEGMEALNKTHETTVRARVLVVDDFVIDVGDEGRAFCRIGKVIAGRYVIEVETLDPSQFPLRRYALEVR